MMRNVRSFMFEEISVKGTRKWKDPETGKQRQQTKKFAQTLNPFNKNPDGTIKTRYDIVREITARRNEWLAQEGEPT